MASESDWQMQNSAQAIEFARECVRIGVLINGGAAVAVLALLSRESTPANAYIPAIQLSLLLFAIGLLSAFFACLAGYFSQTAFAMHNMRRIRDGSSSDIAATIIAGIGVLLMLISVGCFAKGVISAAHGLIPAIPT